MTRFFANADGTYWGGYQGPNAATAVPSDVTEVPHPPPGPHHLWNGSAWQFDATADDAANDSDATVRLNTPINKVLRDVFWDLEQRLRALGRDSALADVAAATTKGAYTTALKGRVKTFL